MGHRVVGCDADSERVNALANGRLPFHEPGAQDLLKEQLAGRRVRSTFTPEDSHPLCRMPRWCSSAWVHPLASRARRACWPSNARGGDIAGAAMGPLVIVEKSTVPAGTGGTATPEPAGRAERDPAGESRGGLQPGVPPRGAVLRQGQRSTPTGSLVGAASPPCVRNRDAPSSTRRSSNVGGTTLIETDITSAESSPSTPPTRSWRSKILLRQRPRPSLRSVRCGYRSGHSCHGR